MVKHRLASRPLVYKVLSSFNQLLSLLPLRRSRGALAISLCGSQVHATRHKGRRSVQVLQQGSAGMDHSKNEKLRNDIQ